MKFQLKIKDDHIGKLEQEIGNINNLHDRGKNDLVKKCQDQKDQIIKLKDMVISATVQIDA